MRAILSDVHGNLEALTAVMADLARHPVTSVYCLGDTVGYGPDPVECLERSRGWDVVLAGNFDHAAVREPDAFAPSAYRSLQLFRRLVGAPGWGPREDVPLLAYLGGLPDTHREDGFLFVHGSPRAPRHEYVFPEDVRFNAPKMRAIGALLDRYCFAGHTHLPGVFVEERPGGWEYHDPASVGGAWRLDGRKTIVNVGSVGQPRDGDPRACYVLLDGGWVTFRRVEYDVEATVRKVRAAPGLDNFLGDRLRDGR